MKWFYLSILLTISISVSAQHEEADPTIYSPNRIVEVGLLGKATENLNKEVRAGDRLELRHIQKDQAGIFTVSLWANKQEVVTTLKRLERIEFEPADLYEFWKVQALRSGSYEQLARNGLQMNTRQGLAEEAFEYLQLLDNNAIRYEDEYLENYLNRLAYQIMPDDLDDGRPGRIRVKVVKDYIPNASMFPNGMMFITTGLLSILDSETELIAVMAHEIAHFAMDHAMLNINAAIKRQRSAEFWSGLATVVAAGAEAYMSAKNGRRFTGELTSGTSALASMIALQINVRMGLKYSREQELRADAGAVAVLNMIDVNPMALASALQKIKDHDIRLGLYRTLDSTGTHPHIDTRINGIAGSKYIPEFAEPSYPVRMAMVNSLNAQMAFLDRGYDICTHYAEKNLVNDMATEQDYLMIVRGITMEYDTPEKNREALKLVKEAKGLNFIPVLDLSKQEALIYFRLNQEEKAKKCLREYKEALEENREAFLMEGGSAASFFYQEQEWLLRMNKMLKRL